MNIKLNNIVKKFDNNIILNDINVSFECNHIYGIIGRNGSGKSVLFKIICGLYIPDSGDIKIDDKRVDFSSYFLEDAGVLIEKPSFIEYMSGLDNLKLLSQIKSTIKEQDIIDLMKKFGLYEDRNKKYYKYSLGMKQKMGIIQAIMENQKIIILDEPFSALDEESVKIVKEVIMSKKDDDHIIIITSHNQDDINNVCDTVYKLDNGKLDKYI